METQAEHIGCCFNLDGSPKLCWMIHTGCNLRCPHCGVFDNDFVAGERGLENAEDIDQVLAFARERGIEKVVVTGGEPTLSPWLLPTLNSLRDEGLSFSLSTNATTLTKRRVGQLRGSGLEKATVSLDGASQAVHDRIRGSGSLRRAERGIARLIDAGVQVSVGAFLHQDLTPEISGLADRCLALGVRRLCLFEPIPRGRYEEHASEFGATPESNEIWRATRQARRRGLAVTLHAPRCDDDACPSGQTIFGAIGPRAFDHCVYKPQSRRHLLDTIAA